MPLASERRRISLLALGRDRNHHRRYYGRDPRVLVRQRNAIEVSRAVDRARDRGAGVDRDRPRLITDVTVATAITLVEAGGGETVTRIVAPTEGWTGRIEVQLLPVFCKYVSAVLISTFRP